MLFSDGAGSEFFSVSTEISLWRGFFLFSMLVLRGALLGFVGKGEGKVVEGRRTGVRKGGV